MYSEFYGFSKKPFSISPDPDFLYSNTTYKELLAVLKYGILEKKGIICLIGEVGTGKTMVINHLTSILEKRVLVTKISFPGLGFHGILDAMTGDFGIGGGARIISERLAYLTDFLVSANDNGHIVALLLDEAQGLGVKSLEFIRMLSNLETPKEKLLQIVLSGQPELKEKLNLPQLRQFKQRVALAFYLKPLSSEEIPLYIAHRIRVAGGHRGLTIFTDEALKLIACYSQGIPRIINSICENALLTGCALNSPQIDVAIVREAANDLMLLADENKIRLHQEKEGEKNTVTPDPIAEKIHSKPTPLPLQKPAPNRAWRWALGLAVLILILMFTPAGTLIDRFQGMNAGIHQAWVLPEQSTIAMDSQKPERENQPINVTSDRIHVQNAGEPVRNQPPAQEGRESDGETLSIYEMPPDEASQAMPSSPEPSSLESTEGILTRTVRNVTTMTSTPRIERAQPPEIPSSSSGQRQPMMAAYLRALKTPQDAPDHASTPENKLDDVPLESFYKRRVYPGDTITSLARDLYGYVNSHVLAIIKAANPNLENLDLIVQDTYINFPNTISGPTLIRDNEGRYFLIIISSWSRSRINGWVRHLKENMHINFMIRDVNITSERKIYQIESDRFKSIDTAKTIGKQIMQIPLFSMLEEEYNEPNI